MSYDPPIEPPGWSDAGEAMDTVSDIHRALGDMSFELTPRELVEKVESLKRQVEAAESKAEGIAEGGGAEPCLSV